MYLDMGFETPNLEFSELKLGELKVPKEAAKPGSSLNFISRVAEFHEQNFLCLVSRISESYRALRLPSVLSVLLISIR